jgi:type I site-specific restriction endonuclease
VNPEQQARQEIDRLLGLAGWAVQSVDTVNLHAARGVAIREFPLNTGFGFADYLLYVDGKACGVVDRRLSIVREVEAEVDANLKRAQALRQAVLSKAFGMSQ